VALPAGLLVSLDALGAALAVVVAAFFARSWRRSGAPMHLLFAAGFALVALGTAAVSSSQFELQRRPEVWDALRIAGHTSGALVLVFAYLSARHRGDARPWEVLGVAAAAGGLFMAFLYVVPPFGVLPDVGEALLYAHVVQFLCYAGCVAFSLEGFRHNPRLSYALVPAGFLAWMFSKYTWMVIDVSDSEAAVGLIYVWRFLALGLFLTALLLPVPRRDAPAAA
jgi:hypothetical protein